jgi:hypothetical protein
VTEDAVARKFDNFTAGSGAATPSTVFAPGAGMLKIQLFDQQDGTVTLELAGRVVGPWVAELSRSCERVLRYGGMLSVDLGGVSFVDRHGVEFLKSLRGRRVALVNCSPFVAEQLKSEP